MNKEQFLKRCETIWNSGLVNEELFSMLRSSTEVYGRLRHVYKYAPERFKEIEGHEYNNSSENIQGEIAIRELIGHQDGLFGQLAGDKAYQLTQMASILAHPCQKCAEDKNAWHTRYGFCEHG